MFLADPQRLSGPNQSNFMGLNSNRPAYISVLLDCRSAGLSSSDTECNSNRAILLRVWAETTCSSLGADCPP